MILFETSGISTRRQSIINRFPIQEIGNFKEFVREPFCSDSLIGLAEDEQSGTRPIFEKLKSIRRLQTISREKLHHQTHEWGYFFEFLHKGSL